MDTLGSPYGYENHTNSGVLGIRALRNYTMMHYANDSCCTLMVDIVIKVESDLQPL